MMLLFPGWNDYVKDKHDTATATFLDWMYCGKPRTGPTYDLIRKSRSQFKLALCYCQQHSDMLRADAHANALTSKDYNRFWKSINQSNNDKSKKYTFTLDGCVGENEIANHWRKHFEQLYNSNADF